MHFSYFCNVTKFISYLIFFMLYFSFRDHILNFPTAITMSTIACAVLVNSSFITHMRVNLQTVIKLQNVCRNPSSSRPKIENSRAVRQRLNWACSTGIWEIVELFFPFLCLQTIVYCLMELPSPIREWAKLK